MLVCLQEDGNMADEVLFELLHMEIVNNIFERSASDKDVRQSMF